MTVDPLVHLRHDVYHAIWGDMPSFVADHYVSEATDDVMVAVNRYLSTLQNTPEIPTS